jgi:tartrate dehydrogenase/decarboxylase/D-malate dehydrogenase
VGAVWAGAMMLDHLGETAASGAIMRAVEETLATTGIRTPDLGGTATTSEVGQELERAIRAAGSSGDG